MQCKETMKNREYTLNSYTSSFDQPHYIWFSNNWL